MSEAQEFLLAAAEKDPENARVWFMLSADASTRGSNDLAIEYMRKATQVNPSDPMYAFAYFTTLKNSDRDLFINAAYEFVKRFPKDIRGAHAIYSLGSSATNQNDKVSYYEEIRTLFPQSNFQEEVPGMIELADIYIQSDLGKAFSLIGEMMDTGDWKIRKEIVESFIEIDKLVQNEMYVEATTKLHQIVLPRFNYIKDFLIEKRAFLRERSGDTIGAYDTVLVEYTKLPSDTLFSMLKFYGTKAGKNENETADDVQIIRDKAAVPAYPFNLGLFNSSDSLSLNSLKGKVVLLTFWFPTCGPCKAEFPHFEAVVKLFNDDEFVYLGINGDALQEGFVNSFVANNSLSFIPLRGTLSFANEKFGVEGFPSNFLIDKDGMIVFSGFRINQTNHRTLELMISSLLER